MLKLSENLKLPLDAVTQTFLIVGKRGSGKSNTAARLVEQFHRAKLPFVVLDPVDTWWGLKADREGGRGLDVYVFGGRHADLPLEAHGGALIAEVLCEHRMSMVLSVKHLSGRERSSFMVAFASTLFQKWGGGPLHIVLEEAHELAPQMAGRSAGNQDNEAAMLGAFKRLWKLGRSSGIGGTAVTQRPASLSKDITTQSEILIAHRTIGPQDVKAVGEWVKYHGEHEDILAELPSLPTGEAFIWAPEFPEGKPLGLQRVTVLRRDTFDSASTPKVGEQRVEPKELQPVDIERLRSKMAATLDKVKADDPKELRKRIVELERQLKAKSPEPRAQSLDPKVVEKPVITDAQLARVEKSIERFEALIERVQTAFTAPLGAIRSQLVELVGAVKAVRQPPLPMAPPRMPPSAAEFGRRFEAASRTVSNPPQQAHSVKQSGDASVGNSGLRRILIALAQRNGLNRRQLGIRASLASRSGTFDTYLSKARVNGWIGGSSQRIEITDAGLSALGSYDPLPEGQALLDHWLAELGRSGAARILRALAGVYPRGLSREELGAAADMAHRSGTFDTYLSKLRTLELIEGSREIKASDEFFQ